MHFTDSHCHLADPALRDRLPEILAQAAEQGVTRFIVPATQRDDWPAVAALSAYGQTIRPQAVERPSENRIQIALGIHPWFAHAAQDSDFVELAQWLRRYPQAWVGETGLDFLKHADDEKSKQAQIVAFGRQLALAQDLQRKVIVHNVKATAAIAAAVKNSGFTQGGIVHAFSGSLEEAEIFVKLGFKIGIGSLLLNPNAKKVRRVAASIDLSAIVLETDSPFMLRDDVNTPSNVRRIAEIVADLRGVSLAEIAFETEKNVEKMLES